MIDQTGWLSDAKVVESPYFNARPVNTDVSVIVIHNISLPPGQFGTGHIQQLFCGTLNRELDPSYRSLVGVEVSSHFLIERSGDIIQFVSVDNRAWHAGLSVFQGQKNCNDFSIGIELEGTDKQNYTSKQYVALSGLANSLMDYFPKISLGRIVGHCDIAPGRKTDPGVAFNWARLRKDINQ